MHKITIVGMGPGSETFLTMEAYKILLDSDCVHLRTERHPIVQTLKDQGMVYKSYDELYESSEVFDDVYYSISDSIFDHCEIKDVVYAVPGNPFVAEKTVSIILERAKNEGVEVKIVHGVSFIDAILTSLRYDPVVGVSILDALDLDEVEVQTKQDYLWIQVYNVSIASNLKLKLMDSYEDDHLVTIIQAAGIPELEKIVLKPLYEMDREPELFNHLTSVFVERPLNHKYGLGDLVRIMRTLRSEDGCPWDREQTHETLAPYLIEEAYEVRHAVIHEDDHSLVDELGDVLLQVVFHATIAEEDGYFELSDIMSAICEKMIRRHPHVFGDVDVKNSDEVLANWQVIKDGEKSIKSIADSMEAVTGSLPALLRSQKVQKKASDIGFDWKNTESAFDKVSEEILELKEAIKSGDQQSVKEEMGDILLIISNIAKNLGLDAELVLNDAIDKFIKRFRFVENEITSAGMLMNTDFVENMEQFWQDSKKIEKS
ncbi:MAG: nucleoside triphosphate pyrophosphohydrolase [Clostridia bacterium]|nr:nucleoside triphosphate pyrophosphohydrolase [Clostridia bacterium]